jgi:cytochrome c biogenesis protein
MALLGTAVLAGQVRGLPLTVALGAALALLCLNLFAALVVHPAFRSRLPLLVAHLALLALVVLVAVGRLTAMDGRFELTQGASFDGTLLESSAGPWHRDGLARLAFVHEGFDIDYAPGRRRGATRNRVRWLGEDGTPQEAIIGDHRPLVLDGYRIYTSPNKGFAPLISWRPHQGAAITGAVHLPSYPMHELRQSREWLLPDGRAVWVMLQFNQNLIDPDTVSAFRLPQEHRLVVRLGGARAELLPGGTVALDGGTLVYEGLRTWMGYRVSYDPTLPWLLASSLLATLALAWHYAQRFLAARALPVRNSASREGAVDA